MKFSNKELSTRIAWPAKPITRHSLILTPEMHQQREAERKLPLLLDHFGIDQASNDKWKNLALELAKQCVTGFKLKTSTAKRGRPQKWNDSKYAKLWSDIDALLQQKGGIRRDSMYTESWACDQLIKRDEWKNFIDTIRNTGKHSPGATLHTIYCKAKKYSPTVKILIEMREEVDAKTFTENQ